MPNQPEKFKNPEGPMLTFDKAKLRERLTPLEYQVTQEKHTERYLLKQGGLNLII